MATVRRQSDHLNVTGEVPPLWTDLVAFELLVYLDFCVSEHGDRDYFEQSVSQYLDDTCQKRYSLTQIDTILAQIWLAHRAKRWEHATSHHRLYETGSNCLTYFSGNRERQKRRSAVLTTLQYTVGTQERSLSRFVNGSSGSSPVVKVKTERQSSERPQTRERGGVRSNTRRFVDIDVSQTSDLSFEEISSIQFEASATSTRRGKRRRSSETLDILPARRSPADLWTNQRNAAPAPSVITLDNSRSNDIECESCQARIQDLETNLEEVHNALADAENNKLELEDKVQSLKSLTENSANGKHEATNQLLKDHTTRICHLEAAVKENAVLNRVIKGICRPQTYFDRSVVEDDMNMMTSWIEGLMVDSSMVPCQLRGVTGLSSADRLLSRIFGSQPGRTHELPLPSLLRSLVSAATCEWVFEHELKAACLNKGILQKHMLSKLAATLGEDIAQDLNFAAHEGLFRSDYFTKCVMPGKAGELAQRLISTVLPIISMLVGDTIGTRKAGIKNAWLRQEARLREIMGLALKVKVHAILSGDTFEATFPVSGTCFDVDSMQEETAEGAEIAGPRGSGSLVAFSLAPGLCWFECERRAIDYISFQTTRSVAVPPSSVIVKPVVALY